MCILRWCFVKFEGGWSAGSLACPLCHASLRDIDAFKPPSPDGKRLWRFFPLTFNRAADAGIEHLISLLDDAIEDQTDIARFLGATGTEMDPQVLQWRQMGECRGQWENSRRSVIVSLFIRVPKYIFYRTGKTCVEALKEIWEHAGLNEFREFKQNQLEMDGDDVIIVDEEEEEGKEGE